MLILAIVTLLLQQHIHLVYGVPCSSNPCNNLTPPFDAANGYCCQDLPPNFTDSVCTCPSASPVLNGPCRNASTTPTTCNRLCFNNGVCNIVNGEQVCWCALGFSGSFCEVQGFPNGCGGQTCQSGSCVEKVIGATRYGYCFCNPGWTGMNCDRCYFTCSQQGVFPDTAYCATGRYFYCLQASGAPVTATCPDGQRFNPTSKTCDQNYNCT